MLKFITILASFVIVFSNYVAYAGVASEEFDFLSKNSDRKLVAEIYYPSNCHLEKKKITHGIWLRENYKSKCDIDSKKKYPLVVFSHGFQGDRFGNSWFAEGLVSKGYIVAMIDHTLNTSYESSDIFVYKSMWQRPADIADLLTVILDDDKWGRVIDKEKIIAAGFSLGGATALWLSGITADKERFQQVMDRKYARWSDWPERYKLEARSVDWAKAESSYSDTRIKGIIAISPDLGEAFSIHGLKKSTVPVIIFVGDKDEVTPSKENADFYANHMHNAKLVTINNAQHFTFMNHCSNVGFKITPHFCVTEDAKEKTHELLVNEAHICMSQVLQ